LSDCLQLKPTHHEPSREVENAYEWCSNRVFCRGPGAQALLQWSFDTRILFEVKYVYVLSLFLKKERMLHIDDFWNKKRVLPAGKIETWHCAAFLFSQVPKKCTNLELSLPYNLTLGTYSKFTQEIKFLAPGFCFPQPCSALSASLLRQDHVYRTTNESFGFHNKKSMKCGIVNWIQLRICVRSKNTQHHFFVFCFVFCFVARRLACQLHQECTQVEVQ